MLLRCFPLSNLLNFPFGFIHILTILLTKVELKSFNQIKLNQNLINFGSKVAFKTMSS